MKYRSLVPAFALGLGLADRGRLEPGARADILVLDPDLRLRRVFIGGEECDVADA